MIDLNAIPRAHFLRRALLPATELLAFVLMTAGICGSVAIFF